MDDQENAHALLREARGLWRATRLLAAATLTTLLGLVVYAEFFMGKS